MPEAFDGALRASEAEICKIVYLRVFLRTNFARVSCRKQRPHSHGWPIASSAALFGITAAKITPHLLPIIQRPTSVDIAKPFAECVGHEVNIPRGTAIKANLLDPGIVATRMRAQAFPGENPSTLTQPEAIGDAFVALAEAACPHHGEIVSAQG